MSVLMTLRVPGDAGKLEALASEKPEVVQQILARAREHGVQAHRFYGTDEELLIVDRWPDADSFQRFMAASPEVGELMAAAGVTGEPEITFWRALDVDDAIE
ncbi:MAG TPA: hypothetical protein VF053_02870 [Streptosporangiales bacterium]